MSDKQTADKPFFVGYLPVPGELRVFLWAVMGGLILLSAGLGYAIGITQDDPGPAALRGDFGRQTVTGVLELTPTPILHVTEGTDRLQPGRTLMLSGQGKFGAAPRSDGLHGELVQASGAILNRGTLEMLQLRGGRNGLSGAEGEAPAIPEPVSLGRWKLAGEICDGKCVAGAMRPGRGLAHKACANLCIVGGVPPVFVSTKPVEGSSFMLIAGDETGTLPEALYDFVAAYVTLEGDLTRHGDLLILKVDADTVEPTR